VPKHLPHDSMQSAREFIAEANCRVVECDESLVSKVEEALETLKRNVRESYPQ
jgi:hypothetical protein